MASTKVPLGDPEGAYKTVNLSQHNSKIQRESQQALNSAEKNSFISLFYFYCFVISHFILLYLLFSLSFSYSIFLPSSFSSFFLLIFFLLFFFTFFLFLFFILIFTLSFLFFHILSSHFLFSGSIYPFIIIIVPFCLSQDYFSFVAVLGAVFGVFCLFLLCSLFCFILSAHVQ